MASAASLQTHIDPSFDAIIAYSSTGETARLTSMHNPRVPIYGVSTSMSALQRMTIYKGVRPLFFNRAEDDVIGPANVLGKERGTISRAAQEISLRLFTENPNKTECRFLVLNGPPQAQSDQPAVLWTENITREARLGK
jgi:pyruvate kinase